MLGCAIMTNHYEATIKRGTPTTMETPTMFEAAKPRLFFDSSSRLFTWRISEDLLWQFNRNTYPVVTQTLQ